MKLHTKTHEYFKLIYCNSGSNNNNNNCEWEKKYDEITWNDMNF